MPDAPLITCVMITGKPDRRPLAAAAIECFRRQTYSPRELLVLSTASEPWIGDDDDEGRIREVRLPLGPSLGELRNAAFELAAGDFLLQWDDDDLAGPRRIAVQAAALIRRGGANVLQNEIFYSLADGRAVVYSAARWRHGGFDGTILHPRTVRARYPAASRGEDTAFLRALAGETTVHAVRNDPTDYLRLVHGANTWDRGHFAPFFARGRPLKPAETAHLRQTLELLKNFQTIR